MLDALTPRESDRLWWRIVRAIAAASDEIDCLKLAPVAVRDQLYGAGCLESYIDLRAELADLADNHVRRTVSSWKSLLDDTPEEGNPQWHDSDAPTPTRRLTWTHLAMRISLARSWRRLTPPK